MRSIHPLLPFLKTKRQDAIVITERKPDEEKEQSAELPNEALQAAAADILRAIRQDDASHLAEAIRAAFQIVDAEPHAEAEQSEE